MFAPTHPLHHVLGGYHRRIHALSPPPTPFDLIYRKKNAKCKPEGPKRRTREGGVNGSR
jgi:hypothetical protein